MNTIVVAFMIVFVAPVVAHARPVRVGGLTCSAGPRVGLVLARGETYDVFSARTQQDGSTLMRIR